MELFLSGAELILTPMGIGLILLGVVIGIIFGMIPGLSASMGVALFLPVTFKMSPVFGISFLVALYIGGVSGGLISAILINIPGTPNSITTCFDGHPMAMRGEAGKALGAGILYSYIGGFVSMLALFFIAPQLAKVALKFGPVEFFSIAMFSLTMIAALAGKSMARGLFAGCFGILLSCVGISSIDGIRRFTFGFYQLDAGFQLLAVLIGLFAVSEILLEAENMLPKKAKAVVTQKYSKVRGFGVSIKEFIKTLPVCAQACAIGMGIGILPGIGGGTANTIAYMAAKNTSKHPEKFGTGILDGIIASETSNNAVTGAALIPLLTLGIPGDGVTAMMLGGFMIHGITPGPLLFMKQGPLVYGIFIAVFLANLFMVIIERAGLPVFIKLLKIPKQYLLPIIMVFSFVGAYTLNNRVFDVISVMAFGLLGYFMKKLDIPMTPILLGFILGPLAEENLRRGLMLTDGNVFAFFTYPIAAVFLVMTVVSISYFSYKQIKRTLATRRAAKVEGMQA